MTASISLNATLLMLLLGIQAAAAPADRITRAIDGAATTTLRGHIHRLASAVNDQGAVEPEFHIDHMVLAFKPSSAQQTELDQLLTDQQNPSSPIFHQWLTPEEFGDRFGLSASDYAKAATWLQSEGFAINEPARGRNWIAFSGSATQVTRTFHTPIHRFQAQGKQPFANTAEPSVPAALGEV